MADLLLTPCVTSTPSAPATGIVTSAPTLNDLFKMLGALGGLRDLAPVAPQIQQRPIA